MQRPVGFEINPARGRVELISLSDVLFNSTRACLLDLDGQVR
jgi:cytochrome bd-type quinol oxidase subunit 1